MACKINEPRGILQQQLAAEGGRGEYSSSSQLQKGGIIQQQPEGGNTPVVHSTSNIPLEAYGCACGQFQCTHKPYASDGLFQVK